MAGLSVRLSVRLSVTPGLARHWITLKIGLLQTHLEWIGHGNDLVPVGFQLLWGLSKKESPGGPAEKKRFDPKIEQKIR